MDNSTKEVVANRLTNLMRTTPGLGTLHQVAKAAGVSYGTVRNVQANTGVSSTGVTIEKIAKAFGYTLAEFTAQESGIDSLTASEISTIRSLRSLSPDDRLNFTSLIARTAALAQGQRIAAEINHGQPAESEPGSQSQPFPPHHRNSSQQ